MEKNRAADGLAGPRSRPGPGATPWRILLPLGGLLLLLHLGVLVGLPDRLGPAHPFQPVAPTALVTRTLPAPEAAAPPLPAPKPPAPARRPSVPAPALTPAAPVEPVPGAATEADPNLGVAATPAEPMTPAVPDTQSSPEVPPSQTAPAPAEPAVPAVRVPAALRLTYRLQGEVRGFPYSAGAELLWSHDGERYEAQLEISALFLGSRRQTSRGQITPQGLAPKRFSDKVRSEVAAHFEYDKGVVIFSANTPQASLQPGAQDQLSIFMQLASLIAADPAKFGPGRAIEMQAVGPRESDQWRFVVDGPQTLDLPGGMQAALQLTRAARQPYEVTVGLWLAPALGYLPVRIRLTQDNGDFVDMLWRSSAAP